MGLVEAGFTVEAGAVTPSPPVTPDGSPPALPLSPPGGDVDDLRARLETVERRLLEAEHRAELAEAVADERGRALEVERALVLMLTQRPTAGPWQDVPGTVQDTAPEAPTAPEVPRAGGLVAVRPPDRATWWARVRAWWRRR